MAEDEGSGGAEAGAAKPKAGKRRLLAIGAALMALTGAGAFAAVSMLSPQEADSTEAAGEAHAAAEAKGEGGDAHAPAAAGAVAFVPVDPLLVTLEGGAGGRTHLRFASQLEVPVARAEEVTKLMPRVVDALGGYLRALEPAMVAEPDAHLRLRAQMLRRVRLVVGAEAVHDLLVMEFVIN